MFGTLALLAEGDPSPGPYLSVPAVYTYAYTRPRESTRHARMFAPLESPVLT